MYQHQNHNSDRRNSTNSNHHTPQTAKTTISSQSNSNMMSFLDLSTASEEERRLIREILSDTSDTSVVNFVCSEPSTRSAATSSVKLPHGNNRIATNPSTITNQQQTSTTINATQSTSSSRLTSSSTNAIVNTYSSSAKSSHGANSKSEQQQQLKNSPNQYAATAVSDGHAYNNQIVTSSATLSNLHLDNRDNKQRVKLGSKQQAFVVQPSDQGINNITTNGEDLSTHSLKNESSISISHDVANSHNQLLPNQPKPINQAPTFAKLNPKDISTTHNNITSGLPKNGVGYDQLRTNTANHYQNLHAHNIPPQMTTATTIVQSTSTAVSSSSTTSVSQQSMMPPTSNQIPPMPNDMNSVIGVDLTSAQPPSYAIAAPHAPAHVTPFGHAPPAQLYGGAPIFQAPPYPYFFTNQYLPYMSYGLLPSANNVVPTRQQAPPQSNQPAGSNETHSRPHPHQQQQHLNQSQIHQHQHQPHHHHNHHHHHQQHNGHNHSRANQRLELSRDIESTSNPNPNISPSDIDPAIVNASASTMSNKNYVNNRDDSKTPSTQSSGDRQTTQDTVGESVTDRDSDNKDITAQTSSDKSEANFMGRTNVSSSASATHKTQETANQVRPADLVVSSTESTKADTSRFKSETREPKDVTASNLAEGKTQVKHMASQLASDIVAANLQANAKLDQSDSSTNIMPNELNESSSTSESAQQEKAASVWNAASSKSWASLFRGDGQPTGNLVNGETEHNNVRLDSIENTKSQKPNARNALNVQNAKEQRSQEISKRALDKLAPQLAQRLSSYTLKHACPNLRPRGFINRGNGCYINSTLQALIACPPFYNLMREVVGDMKTLRRENSCTPILDSFSELFQNFPPSVDSSKKNKQSTSGDQRVPINQLQAEAIEPKCIYNVLGHIKSECLKGAQEDAEEFLSSVLNGLHEEMITLSEILQSSSAQNGHHSDIDESNEDINNDDNVWREVGPRNRSLPIRTAKVVKTPIQEIFGGSLFSLRTAGKDRCGHRSPFFDLQLDISGDNVKTLQDAIKSFTAPEIINNFRSKTKQTLDAQLQTSLDQLPPILILHLKQFIYTQEHGLKKVMKKIEYPIDFELPDYCLHERTSVDRSQRNMRTYKLLAVVYHEGKEAIKGHYLTDVYHIGSSQWIRCDDSNLKVVQSPKIENSDSTRTPYLLIYRRLDTLRLPINNHDMKRKP